MPRTASVRAATPVTALSLTREAGHREWPNGWHEMAWVLGYLFYFELLVWYELLQIFLDFSDLIDLPFGNVWNELKWRPGLDLSLFWKTSKRLGAYLHTSLKKTCKDLTSVIGEDKISKMPGNREGRTGPGESYCCGGNAKSVCKILFMCVDYMSRSRNRDGMWWHEASVA